MLDNLRSLFYRKMFDWFGLVRREQLDPVIQNLTDLYEYAAKSGHLSNGYNAGVRVKRSTSAARDSLVELRQHGSMVERTWTGKGWRQSG